jgi:Phage integrase family
MIRLRWISSRSNWTAAAALADATSDASTSPRISPVPREGRQVRPRSISSPPRPRGGGTAPSPGRPGAGYAGDRRSPHAGASRRHASRWPAPAAQLHHTSRVEVHDTTGQQGRLHGLRHSHATHMLASGIHPKIASERLGHSKIGITLDLYSHVLPGMQEEAIAKVDTLISAALLHRQKTSR